MQERRNAHLHPPLQLRTAWILDSIDHSGRRLHRGLSTDIEPATRVHESTLMTSRVLWLGLL
jgi:hypothetical protein